MGAALSNDDQTGRPGYVQFQLEESCKGDRQHVVPTMGFCGRVVRSVPLPAAPASHVFVPKIGSGTVIFRQADETDAAQICAIANPIIRDTLVTFTSEVRNEAGIAQEIAERGPAFLVAEQQNRVVGFATFFPFRQGPGYARTREHSVQLAPRIRGRGVGGEIMTRLEAVAVSRSVHVLVAGISSANPKAVVFHERLGFSKIGQMSQVGYKQGRWLDLILMQKTLTQGPDGAPDTSHKAL